MEGKVKSRWGGNVGTLDEDLAMIKDEIQCIETDLNATVRELKVAWDLEGVCHVIFRYVEKEKQGNNNE